MDFPKIGFPGPSDMEISEIESHLLRARNGDRSAVGILLESHRGRLQRLVALRLDRRLRGRVDDGDVLQDVFLEAVRRIDEYLGHPTMPFYLWLRFITLQRLQALCREHLAARKRDVRRETPIDEGPWTEATSEALAAQLMGKLTTPSQAFARAETKARLRKALEDLDPLDREVIALRHFEQMTNADAARVMGIEPPAASKRYIRAIGRLKDVLARLGGKSELPWS